MGETSIEWSEFSWNPVRGCSRVSRGCEHCYAEGVARRFAGPGQPYEGLVRLDRDGKAKAQWNGVVRLVPEHLADPLRWKKPRRIFVNSMSDLFHEALSIPNIARVFAVMAHAEQHTFQVLTKRAKRMREVLASDLFWADVDLAHIEMFSGDGGTDDDRDRVANACGAGVLPNVWLGVSVEDQATADERIPHLLACHAAVRWVSYEPAIGPVDFTRWLGVACPIGHAHPRGVGTYMPGECPAFVGSFVCGRPLTSLLDWIVVGGESGPGARPFEIEWAQRAIAQCREAGTACFVKQMGAMAVQNVEPTGDFRTDETTGKRMYRMTAERLVLRDRKGGDINEFPEDLRVRQYPEARR